MRLFSLGKYWFFLMMFIINGCVYPPEGKVETPPPAPTVQKEPYPGGFQEKAQKMRLEQGLVIWQERLNKAINSLQAEIEENKSLMREGLIPEDQNYLAKKNEVISTYLERLNRIKILQQKLNQQDTALYREIYYLELVGCYLACLNLGEELREKKISLGSAAQKLEKELEDSYQKSDYYRVVERYEQLTKIYPEEGRNFKNKTYYALSLARLGRGEYAVKAIEEDLRGALVITCENVPLCFELGEWLINTGHLELAQEVFQKLTAYYATEEDWYKKVKDKTTLLQKGPENLMVRNKLDQAHYLFENKGNFSEVYRLTLEAQKDCLDLTCQNEVQTSLSQFIERAVAQIEGKLREIDEKIGKEEYLKAHLLLSSLRELFPPGDYPLPIKEKLALIPEKERLLNGKKGEWEDEIAKQKMEKANNFLESENYEEAIALFEELKDTPYQIEAEGKRQLAIDSLARLRRLKAGQLFLQAKDCENQEQKKSYLIESYNLLKGVLDQYPNNSYAEKIRKNLEDVRLEIEKLYPEFFSMDKPLEGLAPRFLISIGGQ